MKYLPCCACSGAMKSSAATAWCQCSASVAARKLLVYCWPSNTFIPFVCIHLRSSYSESSVPPAVVISTSHKLTKIVVRVTN